MCLIFKLNFLKVLISSIHLRVKDLVIVPFHLTRLAVQLLINVCCGLLIQVLHCVHLSNLEKVQMQEDVVWIDLELGGLDYYSTLEGQSCFLMNVDYQEAKVVH